MWERKESDIMKENVQKEKVRIEQEEPIEHMNTILERTETLEKK